MSQKIRNVFYFPLLIVLLRSCRGLPDRLREIIIRTIAKSAYLLSWRKRRLTVRALDAAFGSQLGAAQKRAITEGAFYQFWRETFWMVPSATELERVKTIPLRGEEHLHAALGRGAGVIFLESNSFGSRALARRVLHANGYALHQVHAEQHIGSGFSIQWEQWNWAAARFRRFFEPYELKFVTEMIYLPNSDSLAFTRLLLVNLKRNAMICMAGDGRHSQRMIDLPFLGVQRRFSTGMISLARASGATLLPLYCIVHADGKTETIIEAPIDVSSEPSREVNLIAGVHRIASILEQYCRKYPDQFYGWSEHMRSSRGANQEEPSRVN
jgi:lauroyl/myristoyl acyltransferase